MQQGGFYLNNRRESDLARTVAATDLIEGRLAVLRAGKKSFFLIRVQG